MKLVQHNTSTNCIGDELPHAERGKSLQAFILAGFLAGLRFMRRLSATQKGIQKPISNFYGSERIRTSEALSGLTVFKTVRFNHSRTLPFSKFFKSYSMFQIACSDYSEISFDICCVFYAYSTAGSQFCIEPEVSQKTAY